jgi:hypothetical protein
MNPYLKEMAKELAKHINQVVNIPWLNEEQEQMFFELVVTKVFELTLANLLHLMDKKHSEEVIE